MDIEAEFGLEDMPALVPLTDAPLDVQAAANGLELLESTTIPAISVDGVTNSVTVSNDTILPRAQATELKVLTGSAEQAREGSFVKTSQGTATEQGFRNVSQYWYPKTLSYEAGLEIFAKQSAQREDILFNIRDLDFHVDGEEKAKIVFGIDGRELTVSDWAMKQLMAKIDVPTTMWNAYGQGDRDDLQLIADALHNGIRKIKADKDYLFRTYKDSGTIRGIMSDKYSIVENEWYLEVLKEFVPGGRLSHFHFASADNFYGNVLIPDTIRSEQDSEFGGMLACGNSAIGQRAIFQRPSIFAAICMNGCVWGATNGIGLRRKHIGIDLVALKEMIRVNIELQIPLLTTKIGALIDCHNLPITGAAAIQVFAHLAKVHNLGKQVLNTTCETWLKECNAEKTAYGVQNAFTRAGQLFDADTYETCNVIGGDIVNMGTEGWAKLMHNASCLTDKELGKLFGDTLEQGE